MSNGAVGAIYATIIDRIIEAARNDFEEGGYDQRTLEELKEQWQKNLSDFSIAQLPWDPSPPQPQQIANPPTVPSNVGKIEPSYVKSEVKQEAGYANGFNPNSSVASQRAANLLQQQFGSQANASITAAGLQQHQQARPGLSLPGHQQQAAPQRPTHIQLPGMPTFPANDLGSVQLDGSADAVSWTQARDSQRASGSEGRLQADATLRAQLDASVNIIDSGLFSSIPAQPHKTSKIPRARSDGIPQLDGADDDDDVKAEDDADADAINSDLDDDDEAQENVDDEGEGPVGETILCTYDKVQRVKNKWKCVLKDGILTTGNKEYVFHKANGEFEW